MPKSASEYLKQPYARVVIPDETGGFTAEILEFPGCFAEGETPNDAMVNLERAAEAWVQASLDNDIDVPEPSRNAGFSGRVVLRLPRAFHRQAVELAKRNGTSLNQYLVGAVGAMLGAENLYGKMAERLEDKLKAANTITITEQITQGFLDLACNNAEHQSVQ